MLSFRDVYKRQIEDIATVDTGAEAYLCGDADGDGTVDIIDAMLVFYHVAKKELMTDEQCRRCEMCIRDSVSGIPAADTGQRIFR